MKYAVLFVLLGLLVAACSTGYTDRPKRCHSAFQGDGPPNYSCISGYTNDVVNQIDTPLIYLPKENNPWYVHLDIRDEQGQAVARGSWSTAKPTFDFVPYTKEQAALKWDALKDDAEYIKFLDENVNHSWYRFWTRGLELPTVPWTALSYRPGPGTPPGRPHEPWEKNA